MRAFLLELGRLIGTMWSKTWRWAFQRPLNLVITLAAFILVVVVTAVVLRPATETTLTEPRPSTSAEPTETAEPMIEVTGEPITPGSTAPTDESPPAPATSEPIDTSDPESIARAWANIYFTRTNPADTDWVDELADFTAPELVNELTSLAFLEGTPLSGATNTTVTLIEVTPRMADAPANTPVRWSQTLTVTVVDGAGETTIVRYGVVLHLVDDGWALTDVTFLGYGES